MINKQNPSRSLGFKPQVARDILGTPKERFRYWKKKLDSNPYRSHFSFMDIMVYRLFKSLIDGKTAQVEDMANFNFSKLFTVFNNCNYKELRKLNIALDKNSYRIHIVNSKEELIQYMRNNVVYIDMNELYDDQIQAFTEYGKVDNIVSMSKFSKS